MLAEDPRSPLWEVGMNGNQSCGFTNNLLEQNVDVEKQAVDG